MISALHDCIEPILACRHESSSVAIVQAFEKETFLTIKKVINFPKCNI